MPFWWADGHQLQRVLNNLVGNALENIAAGRQVSVTAALVPKPVAKGKPAETVLKMEVSDTGPGIPPDQLPHLFERYYVGNRTRQKIGSGLGLYICKMIMTLHGGTIEVQSELGHGARFILTLPDAPESPEFEKESE